MELAQAAREALLDKKAESVVILDLRGLSEITDFCVLASGSSGPQLKGMLGEVQRALRARGVACYRQSADQESGWVVLDYVDVVIHMMSREARQYYAIEELWALAPRVS